jgi:hypothetical protein
LARRSPLAKAGSNPLAPTNFPPKPSTLLGCSRVLGAGFGPHLAQNSHKQQPTVVRIGACASQPELSQVFEAGMWKLTGLIHPVYINAIVEFALNPMVFDGRAREGARFRRGEVGRDRRAPIHWGHTPIDHHQHSSGHAETDRRPQP